MRGKQLEDEGTDPETEVNGCDSATNNSPVRDTFSIDRTPTADNQKAQLPDTPRSQTPDVEVVFKNLDCVRKYQSQVEEFFKNLLSNGETFIIHSDVVSVDRLQSRTESMDIDHIFTTPVARPPPTRDTVIYTSPFTALLDNTNETDEKTKKRKIQKLTCFNCMGDHHMKNCPETFDGQRISNNRRDFFQVFSPSRYHVGESLPPNVENLRAGVISQTLRNALGLRSDQLPPYIYTMRLLGYPPGWLEDSHVEASGLLLFDSEKKIKDVDTTGEIKEHYDGTKFIKYPGFNCYAPEEMSDEWREYDMPPMQSHQLLTEALKHNLVSTTASNAYKKRRQDCPASSSKKSKSNNDSSSDSTSETCESPTANRRNSDESMSSPASLSVPVVQGVPILDTPNAETELPDSNKFSSGITEHLNFENLPDAVGKFFQVRNVLGQVRQRLTKDN